MIDTILARFENVKKQGSRWTARCSAHDDSHNSLSLSNGAEGKVLLHCHAGCEVESVLHAAGLEFKDLYPDGATAIERRPRIVAGEYTYHDANNQPALKVTRYEPKDFRQQRWDGPGWSWQGEKPKLLYRTPELLAEPKRFVLIAEGEKDVDRLVSLGFLATCNPGGAGKWQPGYTEILKGRLIGILSDNDSAGHKHALKLGRDLLQAGCIVRIIPLPDVKEKGDVSDWLDAGHTGEELRRVIGEISPLDVSTLADLEREWLDSEPVGGGKNLDLLSFGFHDAGNAQRFIARCGNDFRYCYEFRKWLVFDGKRWVRDAQGMAEKRGKQVMVEFLDQAVAQEVEAAEKWARASLNVGRIVGALALSQCELPIESRQLDASPFLLNCKNGTLDLKTADLHTHQREDFLTKLVPFDYHPQAECPRFREFVYEIMGSTPEASQAELERADRLVDFLQRVLGYAITGDVSEKIVVCFFGSGNNGKTTLLEAVRHPLAEYSQQILIDSLMTSYRGRESTNTQADLADLKGARLVVTSEGESGQRLAQAKLKYLSQGMGDIKAVRKYENPITFKATHKLFIDSNFRPKVKANDKAAWERLRPVPFDVVILDEKIDRELLAKLKGEVEGILSWLVEGCLKWRREGLSQPEEIQQSNKAWREENDQFTDFLSERCTLNPDAADLYCGKTDLMTAYRSWAKDNGEQHTLSRNEVYGRIEQAGCSESTKKSVTTGKRQRVFLGIGLGLENE